MLCQPRHGHAQSSAGVEQARSVHMDRQAVLVGQRADGREVIVAEDAAAAAVVGVLHADQARGGEVDIREANGATHLVQVQPALLVIGNSAQAEAAKRECPPGLVVQDVRLVTHDHLVAAPAVR